jgi:hypothetical protein
MTSRCIKVALLSAFVLTNPLLTFARGDSARIHVYSKSDMQNHTGATPAVNLGKGSGNFRYQKLVSASKARSSSARPNWGDCAFRK